MADPDVTELLASVRVALELARDFEGSSFTFKQAIREQDEAAALARKQAERIAELEKELRRWKSGAQRIENGKEVIDVMDLLKSSVQP
jgi:hypothetical protein